MTGQSRFASDTPNSNTDYYTFRLITECFSKLPVQQHTQFKTP